MKIYLAGPMRGLPEYNMPAFDEARERWKKVGCTVFCPAMLFRAMPYLMEDHTRESLNHVALQDLNCVMQADAIALLPGWEQSVGATMELALAQFLCMSVYDAMTMKPISLPRCPWYTTFARVDGLKELVTSALKQERSKPCT